MMCVNLSDPLFDKTLKMSTCISSLDLRVIVSLQKR
jgi:hypothetical protein